MKKRYGLFFISIGLIVALILYSDPLKVFNAFLSANPLYILLGLLFWFLGSIARTYRWKYFLGKVDIHIDFFTTYRFYTTGLFLSNLTPAKTGDPLRPLLLKRRKGESFSKGLSSVFLERVLDLVALIPISVAGIFLLTLSLNISVWWLYLAVAFYSALMISGAYIITSKQRTERVVGRLVSWFSFIDRIKQLEERVEYFSEKLSRSLKVYKKKKTLVNGLLLTYLVWILGAIPALMAFYAVGVYMPFSVLLVVKSTALLLSVLTLLPGSLGSGDIISVSLFAGILGQEVSLLTTGKILGRLVNFWMYAVIGGLFLLIFFKKELEV